MAATPLSGLSVLVLDDEPLLRRHLVATLERLGADVASTDTLRGARQLARDLSFDFALLDVNLPDGKGTELLAEKAFGNGTGVILMTAEGGIAAAVSAMKLGALDYLPKPFEPEALALSLTRVRKTKATERVEEHRQKETTDNPFYFGDSLANLQVQLERILHSDRRMQTGLAPVLIQGETGTGKTAIARWIHSQGPRAYGPLVEMNCSAIPESLAESELFGHEKGAFTDARSGRIGLFEAATGGTLFLDELASLSISLQAKLLTVLEERRIRRVGANREIPVDVRVIGAANRELRQLVAEGRFREDLFHRLDLFRIVIPPLRERGNDILQLAEVLLQRQCRRHRLPPRTLSPLGRRRLLSYSWPGNVRELAHEIERAVVFEDNLELHFDQLMGVGGKPLTELPNPSSDALTPQPNPATTADWFNPNFRFPETGFSLEDAILRLIQHGLEQTSGNVSAAARLLGVSRDYLRYRINPPPSP
ncbi:MAG: sigma-54-dependent Fis family transcriptional regulator [Pedosphaera sp.]|nr:sigma-54-dependent Fis family transcriptional regulator [Pedosphaera sp.]